MQIPRAKKCASVEVFVGCGFLDVDAEVGGTAAECENIDVNYALNPLDLVQELSVKGGIAFNYFLIAEPSL